ncbi:MAG: hypothetical protein WA459_07520 [Stellaceae bacterium]
MSTLEKRLRLRRHQYEERRRHLVEFASLAQRLRADRQRLQADIDEAIAAGDPVSAEPLLDRHSKLARSLAAIEGRIGTAGEALAAAARELRWHELACAQHAGPEGLPDGRRASRPPHAPIAAPSNTDRDRSD